MTKAPEVQYLDEKTIDAGLNRFVEGSAETERTAARAMKAMKPLLEEVVCSGDLEKLSGFIRGISSITASLVLSLPPHMRDAVRNNIRRDLEFGFAIEHPVEERRE